MTIVVDGGAPPPCLRDPKRGIYIISFLPPDKDEKMAPKIGAELTQRILACRLTKLDNVTLRLWRVRQDTDTRFVGEVTVKPTVTKRTPDMEVACKRASYFARTLVEYILMAKDSPTCKVRTYIPPPSHALAELSLDNSVKVVVQRHWHVANPAHAVFMSVATPPDAWHDDEIFGSDVHELFLGRLESSRYGHMLARLGNYTLVVCRLKSHGARLSVVLEPILDTAAYKEAEQETVNIARRLVHMQHNIQKGKVEDDNVVMRTFNPAKPPAPK